MPKRSLTQREELLAEVEAIKGAVAQGFGIALADLQKQNRQRAATIPRQIAVYLTKLKTDATLAEIGTCFGLHHTSVLHAIARIDELRKSSPEAGRVIETIERILTEEKP